MTTARLLALPLLALPLMGCPITPPVATPNGAPPDVRAAIQAGDEAWSAAFIAGDSAAMHALYTEDVVSMQADAPDLVGRDAMVADLAHGFAVRKDTTTRIETVIDNLETSGTLAWEVGHVTLYKRAKDSLEVEPRPHRFKYITFWQRGGDGRWRIRRDLGVGDPLPAN